MSRAIKLLRKYLAILGQLRSALGGGQCIRYIDVAISFRKLKAFCNDNGLSFKWVVRHELKDFEEFDSDVIGQLLVIGAYVELIKRKSSIVDVTYEQLVSLWAYLEGGFSFEDARDLIDDIWIQHPYKQEDNASPTECGHVMRRSLALPGGMVPYTLVPSRFRKVCGFPGVSASL